MKKLTGFGMKNSTTLQSLADKYFNSLRNEKNEHIYTYNIEYMRHIVRQSTKDGRCTILNEYQKSSKSDNVFNNISQELNFQSNICETIDKFFEFTNNFEKTSKAEYDSQFDDYRNFKPRRKN